MQIAAILILSILLLVFLFWTLPQVFPPLLLVFRKWDKYRFEARAEVVGEVQNLQDIDTFEVSIRGRIITPHDHCDTDIKIQITDSTELLRPLKILCVDPQMQKDASGEFFFQNHHDVIPGRNVILSRWRTVMKVSLGCLRFPHRGQRRLLFTVELCDTLTGSKIVETKTILDYFVNIREGYLDFQQRQEKILAAGCILARQTAGQSINPSQENLIEQWLNQVTANRPLSEDFHPEQFMADTPLEILQKAAAVLMDRADAAFRYDLMMLCLHVAEADKPVRRPTQDWLRAMAAALGIAPDRFRAMYQKVLPLAAQENPDPVFVLGIDESLSPDELAERLTAEYQKWNSRVNHPDPQVRKQADEMLSYLTAIRNNTAVKSV